MVVVRQLSGGGIAMGQIEDRPLFAAFRKRDAEGVGLGFKVGSVGEFHSGTKGGKAMPSHSSGTITSCTRKV